MYRRGSSCIGGAYTGVRGFTPFKVTSLRIVFRFQSPAIFDERTATLARRPGLSWHVRRKDRTFDSLEGISGIRNERRADKLCSAGSCSHSYGSLWPREPCGRAQRREGMTTRAPSRLLPRAFVFAHASTTGHVVCLHFRQLGRQCQRCPLASAMSASSVTLSASPSRRLAPSVDSSLLVV